MVADIRAQISCNLGEVISGNWSDEALAVGQGLIRCRGQLILRGIVVPAAGAIVRLAYVRDGQLARVPRILRVLSSFADPLRQITTVQLGDKLVWLEQRKQGPSIDTTAYPNDPEPGQPLDTPLPYPPPEFGNDPQIERRVFNGICWKREIVNPEDEFAFDWSSPSASAFEQNPDRPADEELRAPVTIAARTVFIKCLAALALTSTGIPLSSDYEESQVDLKNGYVAAMEQLLSAESYVGFLDEQERLVIQPTQLLGPSAGPLISETDIIDIAPIGSGELPTDDPVISFEEKQREPAKQPEPVAPIVSNFVGGASYNGDVVTLTNGQFTGRAWRDPATVALARRGATLALHSISGGTGGSVTQTGQGVVFTPEQGFNGTATFTYQVTDGYQLSNSATVYIRVKDSAPTPEELTRDLEEKPPEEPPPPEPPPPGGPQGGGASWSFSAGSEEKTTVAYTLNGVNQTRTYTHYPSSSTRESANLRGNIDYKEERQQVGRAASLGNALQRHLEAGASPDVDGAVTVTTITQTRYRQIKKGSSGGENKPTPERPIGGGGSAKVCTINGECPADLAFPENSAAGAIHRYGECSYRFNGIYWEVATETTSDPDTEQTPRLTLRDAKDQGLIGDIEEEPVSETVTTYEPGVIAIGSLSWPEGIFPPLSYGSYEAERVETNYMRNRSQGITRTITTRYAAAYKTPEGQQRLNAQSTVYGSGLDVGEWLRSATTLVFAGQTSSTRYDANYGVRPAAPAAVPTPDQPDSADSADTGGGDPPPTKTLGGNPSNPGNPGQPDLSLPLSPAIPKTWDRENGYQERWDEYQRQNANTLALRYARAQRSIAHGNRYGMSLQLVPWVMPRYPLESIYLDLAGVVGAYRTNGITVAFDSNGVVANVDALLVGGVGGTGPAYFPVPSTVTSLPPVTSSTTTPGAVPWSSIPLPPDFDPAAPGDVLESIPSQDTVEYPESLLPDFIIPPAAQTIGVDRGIRVGLRVKRLDYSALPIERAAPVGIVVGISAARVFFVASGQFAVTGIGAGFIKVLSLAATAGAFAVAGNNAGLAATRRVTGDPGAFSVAGIDASLQPSMATLVANAGSLAVTGINAQPILGRLVGGEVGSFAVTGNDATLTVETPGSARYWRVNSLTVSGLYLEISELQFFNGATQRTGTLTASSTPASGLVSNLNDGNLSTRCYWDASVANNGSFWIQMDLGSAQLVNGIKQGGFDTSNRYMSAFTLQYSSDASSWTTLGSASGLSYPGNNTLSALITVS